MPQVIRRARTEDTENILPLLRLLFSIEEDFTFDANKQKQGLQLLMQLSSAAIFLMEKDGNIIGMVTGQITISTAEGGPALLIEDLVVVPEQRGKGIARSLLESVRQWASTKGASRMQLLADCNNKTALSFYESCGWKQTQLICLRKFHKE